MGTNISGLNIHSVFYKYFDNSFFKKYFNLDDPDVIQLSLNLLEKLYGKGILAEYVQRNQGELTAFADEDFISFFSTQTHFWSVIIKYARLYKDITQNDLLKRDFFRNIGIFYSVAQTEGDLDYLFENYITEFQKRGTDYIHFPAGENGQIVDGELLRIISKTVADEFLFALLSTSDTGWCLGHSSPEVSCADHITNLIKGYEFDAPVTNLALYPLLNPSYITLSAGCLHIAAPSGYVAGMQYDNIQSKQFTVDPKLDYEISFRVTFVGGNISNPPSIAFGFDAFDINGNEIQLQNLKTGDFISSNQFCTFLPSLMNTEYWVRGAILNAAALLNANDQLNISIGNNFKFNTGSSVVYVIPKIIVSGTGVAPIVNIRDVKVCLAYLPFSLGQLGAKNLVINFLKNNSGGDSNVVNATIRDQLLPYNVIYQPYNL